MPRKSKIRGDTVKLIDDWLKTKLGEHSEEKAAILSAREKIISNTDFLSSEEANAVTSCVMDLVDIESEISDDIITLLDEITLRE